jgi:hypothetical protein
VGRIQVVAPCRDGPCDRRLSEPPTTLGSVSAIKPYQGFGDVDHTIKELMSL